MDRNEFRKMREAIERELLAHPLPDRATVTACLDDMEAMFRELDEASSDLRRAHIQFKARVGRIDEHMTERFKSLREKWAPYRLRSTAKADS